MDVFELIRSMAAATRAWRERAFLELQQEGCSDLSHRPRSDMSSIGWLLAHQAAAYDYVLNMLIQGNPPKNPDLFYLYRGDSNDKGDWAGTSLQEINDYFDLAEGNFLSWFERASDKELNHVLKGPNIPQYFNGMRVIEAIADMFAHLNHHNGHLSAIKGDWCRQEKK
jgi:hypothetical protein